MAAFGATPEEVLAAQTFSTGSHQPNTSDTNNLPDALVDHVPARVETSQSNSLSAQVYVYEDGSLATSIGQTGPIHNPRDAVLQFDSATIDFGEISDALARPNQGSQGTGGLTPMAAPSGCDSLPNSGGWIRRADCFVYDSVNFLRGVSASAYFDYSVKSGAGRIDRISANDAQCTVAPVTHSAYIYRQDNVGSTPAQGIHKVDCNWGYTHTTHNQRVFAYGSAWSSMD